MRYSPAGKHSSKKAGKNERRRSNYRDSLLDHLYSVFQVDVMTSTTKPLTRWEAGQELVKVADALSEAAAELDDHPDLQKKVAEMRKDIAEFFYKTKLDDVMGFGI